MSYRHFDRRLASLAVLGFLAQAPGTAFALQPASNGGQEQAQAPGQGITIADENPNDPKVFTFDYGVPSSPGLTLLGIDTDKITQSNSLKPFVLSLPGLLASKGEGKAVALDASLGALFIPGRLQRYSEYRRNARWFRTRINIALYEGVQDADAAKQKASRLALGASTSLLNSSDPLLARFPSVSSGPSAYIACLDSARTSSPTPMGQGHDPEVDALTPEQRLTCTKIADLAAQLGTDLDLGAGFLLEGHPGKLEGFGHGSLVLWGSFRASLGHSGPTGHDYADYKKWYDEFGRWFMIGASGRAAFGESIATGDAATPQVRADSLTAWAGLESYSKTNRFAFQIGQQRISPNGGAFDRFGGTRTVYHASFDQSLGDTGLWVSFSYGKAEGHGALKSDSVARVTLTFAAPDARKIFGGP